MPKEALPPMKVALKLNNKGSVLPAVLIMSAVGSALVVGALTTAGAHYDLSVSRANSEAALLIAEAALNDEMAAIASRSTSGTASTWVTAPTLISGQPYRGRKGAVDGAVGDFWVYASTTPYGTTAWTGTGPVYLNSTARVGGAIRKASLEVKITGGGSTSTDGCDFNALVFNGATTQGGHSEGPVAICGTWQGPYEINQHTTPGKVNTIGNIGLWMCGNITRNGNVKKVFNGYDAHVSGSIAGTLQRLGNGKLITTMDGNWISTQSSLWLQRSEAIEVMNDQRIDCSDMNNINVNVSSNTLNGSTRVFWVNATDVKPLKTINFNNMAATDTVIVNVIGPTVDWGWTVNAPYKNRICWNFVCTDAITVKNRAFTGMMLAVHAQVKQYNNIQGNMICNNWQNFGAPELHFTGFKFAGSIGTGSGGGSGSGASGAAGTAVTFEGSYNAS